MRILYIGHAYMVAENQKKIQALANLPNIEVALILPHRWPDPPIHPNLTPYVPAHSNYQIKILRALWPGVEQYYVYMSPDLAMRHFKPDVICVEQGAGAFVYTQSLIYRNLYVPQAKAIFFTWWNLPYRASLPLRLIERFNLSQTQGAIVGNQEAADILRDHGYGGPLLRLPQLGVDAQDYHRFESAELRQKLGLTRFTVGYTGRFVEEKGIRVLLQALAGVSFDFQLLMIGRGPLEDEIRQFATQQSWGDRLKIVSGVSHSEMAGYQNCMDVMVVPSLTRPFWKEQFGHVIIEAMACEVPVIGSDSAEVPRVIGEAGLVIPEGDVPALQATLRQTAESVQLRRSLGEAGRRRVLENYTNENIAQRLVNFFQDLI